MIPFKPLVDLCTLSIISSLPFATWPDIRQAARALNVAPSSISRVIKGLEDELGTPLFERVRQRLKLTSAGELLLYHARQSITELARAWSEINDLSGPEPRRRCRWRWWRARRAA